MTHTLSSSATATLLPRTPASPAARPTAPDIQVDAPQPSTAVQLLAYLHNSPEARQRLAHSFDLIVNRAATLPAWLRTAPLLEVFGRDCIDGVYLRHVLAGQVVYVSREGTAGCIAGSLSEWLRTLMALPSWRDLLECADRGDPLQMRRLAPRLEQRDLVELSGLADDRRWLRHALQLDEARFSQAGPYADPVGRLHHAVLRLPAPPAWVDGRPCGPLFGDRTADDLV